MGLSEAFRDSVRRLGVLGRGSPLPPAGTRCHFTASVCGHAWNLAKDWIENGFPEEIEIPEDGFLSVPGNPGLRDSLRSALEERIGDKVVVMLYNGVGGEGSTSIYDCTTFLAVAIVGVSGNGTNLSVQVQITRLASSSFIIRESAPENSSVGKTVLMQ